MKGTDNFVRILKTLNPTVGLIFILTFNFYRIRFRVQRLLTGRIRTIRYFQCKVENRMLGTISLENPKIYCKKGCSNCCHIPVTITRDEADSIIEDVRLKGIDFNRERAKLQTKRDYLTLKPSERACIFLNGQNGACSIYESRPMVCRIHYSSSEPSTCLWTKKNENTKLFFIDPLAEIMTSGVWDSSRIGSLPEMILEADNRKLPNCKLCLTRLADKKNSHIIPKFMCKGLFEQTEPRHALAIDQKGKGRKVQDTPKEDHILCETCEKRIEIVETQFAGIIKEIHAYKDLPTRFIVNKIGTQEYLECLDIHPTLFKLFLYSLVWRASISKLFEYLPFNLTKIDEEKIRGFLDANLTTSKKSLLEILDKIENVPLYHSCIIKPIEKSTTSRGIFSICSMSENSHVLFLIDFAILFYTDEVSIGTVLERFSNKQNEKVIVALGQREAWLSLNQAYLSKMLNANKK